MTSAVDATKPSTGSPTTASVRSNFAALETEVNELHRMTEDYVVCTGSADAYVANFTNDVTLADGVRVTVQIPTGEDNATTTPQITVDGTADTITRPDGSACVAGDLLGDGNYDLMFDGTNWRVLNPSSVPTISSTLMQLIYPVGHIYTGTTSTNPDTLLFGGNSDTTWTAFGEGRVLVGYDDTSANGVAIEDSERDGSGNVILDITGHGFAVGQEITVVDVTGFTDDPNGTFTITAITANTVTYVDGNATVENFTTTTGKAGLFGLLEDEDGSISHQLTEAEMPAHTHTQEGGNGGAGSGYQANAGGNEFPTEATSSTGGDENHNNVQPSIVVYMWKRTA